MGHQKYAPWTRLIENTIGAVRHVMEKHGRKGFMPVGFSIVFYSALENDPEKKWYYDMRNIINSHETDFGNPKLKERIDLVNEFLAAGVKKILEGEIDDLTLDKTEIDETIFQIPGMKGKS